MGGGAAELHKDDTPFATGTHKNATSAVLSDPGKDFKSCGVATGVLIKNTTDGSSGTITAVAEDSVTGTLSGGTLGTNQDFTTFNITDPNGKTAATTSTITLASGDRDEDYYLTKDFGSGHFGDFSHAVDVNVSATADDVLSLFFCWTLSNADDDLNDIDIASGDFIGVNVNSNLDGTDYFVGVINVDGGTYGVVDTSSSVTYGTEIYLTISRVATTITVQIYSTTALRNAGGAGDIDTLTGTCVNTEFRYVYGLASYNTGDTAKDISGTVSNFVIHNIWKAGDTYEIYITDTEDSVISTQWTELRFGRKSDKIKLHRGLRAEDMDLDEFQEELPDPRIRPFGPGQPMRK